MPSIDEVRNALIHPNISSFPQDQQAQATRQLSPNPGAGLNLAASDPQSFGGQVGSQAGNSDYANKFGTALQGLLKQYQTLGTKPFQEQALNASDAQTNASTTALTNPSLQGYNPGTIMNAGQSAAAPFNPVIQGAENSKQTFSEQLRGFGDILNNAQSFLKEQQATKDKAQSQAKDLIHEAINVGSDAIAALLESQPDLIKAAGYNKDTILGIVAGLKKQEAPKPTGNTTSVSERLLLSQKGVISKYQSQLDQEKQGSTDSFSNPNTYRKAKSEYVANGGTPSDFFQVFPLEVYISPPNRKGDLLGSAAEIKIGGAVSDEQELQSLLSKSDQGNDLSKLNLGELKRFQQLYK